MGVNVVNYNGNELINLSGDTVTPETLAKGTTAHNAAGDPIVGEFETEVTIIQNVPSVTGSYTYNGNVQSPTLVNYDSSLMTMSGGVSGVNAGAYTIIFTPNAGCYWTDGSTDSKSITWTIAKAAGSLSISPTTMTLDSSTPSSTIEVTRAGDGVITATSSDTSIATVIVSGTTVKVNGVDNTRGTATITIKVAAGTNHTAPSDKTCEVTTSFVPARAEFSSMSWSDIQKVCKAGLASSYWSIGDKKYFYIDDENGYEVQHIATIIGFDHDTPSDPTSYGRSKVGITMVIWTYVPATSMNTTATNSGGWKNSNFRTSKISGWKNTYFNNYYGRKFTEVLVPVSKKSGKGGGSSSGTDITTDTFFLLAEIETLGTSKYSVSGEGSQYAYFANGNVLDYFNHLLRSPRSGDSTEFCVCDDTYFDSYPANETGAGLLACCI